MPKRRDPSLTVRSESGNEYYQSRLDTSREHNKKSYDSILVRVEAGSKDALTKWVEERAEEDPDNPLYNDVERNRPSVNSFVVGLLEEATGLSLRAVPKKRQKKTVDIVE